MRVGRPEIKGTFARRIERVTKRAIPYSKDLIKQGLMDISHRPFVFGIKRKKKIKNNH